VSASKDKYIILWDVESAVRIRTLCTEEIISCLSISSEEQLICGSMDGNISRWDLTVGDNIPSDKELADLIIAYYYEKKYLKVKEVISNTFNGGLLKTFEIKGESLVHWLVDSENETYIAVFNG